MTNSRVLSFSGSFAILLLAVFPHEQARAEGSVNETTSYAKHNDYYCRVATEDGLRPNPTALDHFRMHDISRGIADLYGDGSVEMIFGASDETFSQERADRPNWPGWVYEGNEQRSRQRYQYAFYSPQTDFQPPKGTRYIGARAIITQDFNGDGIDDLAMAVWGTDYAPFVPFRNEILLSSPDGYQARYLPGPAMHAHGATAGDIDNDGDIDLIIAEGSSSFQRSSIYILTNDGTGSFTRRETNLAKKSGHVSLYDIDGDGNLDLYAVDTRDNVGQIEIHWGLGNGSFANEHVTLFDENWISTETYQRGSEGTYQHFRHRSFQEPAFVDTDNDGLLNIIIPSNQDFHFSLYDLELSGRQVAQFEEIYRSADAPNAGMIPTLNWMNSCDLGGVGFDLVFEVFGQRFYHNSVPGAELDFSRTERVVFRNDGSGKFDLFKLESPLFFSGRTIRLLREYADYLGVAKTGYEPAQVYYSNTFDQARRFFHPSYKEMRRGDQLLPFNTVPELTKQLGFKAVNGGNAAASSASFSQPAALSDRAQRILNERRSKE